MNKQELKSIIKECVREILTEAPKEKKITMNNLPGKDSKKYVLLRVTGSSLKAFAYGDKKKLIDLQNTLLKNTFTNKSELKILKITKEL